MTIYTPKLALPYPHAVDPDNVPADMLALATALDNKMVGQSSGTLAARPAGGSVYGKWYYATDVAFAYNYQPADANATAGWRQIGALPTVPVARWHNVSSQLAWTDASGLYPDGGAFADLSIAWHQEDFQRDGFATSGPYPRMPTPGVYRIGGQVAFVHQQSVRSQQEQFSVLVWRRNDDGSRGALLSYDQATGDAIYSLSSIVTVPFHVMAAFDLTANNKAIEVAVTSSYPVNPPSDTQGIYIYPGTDQTFLDLALVSAL